MYLGTQKIEKIENDTVTLEGGLEIKMNEKARARMLTEEPDEKSDERSEKELAKKVLEIINSRDIRLSLDKETLEQNQTDVVADVVKMGEAEGYTLDELSKAFHDIMAVVRSAHQILSNNVSRLQEDVYVKALGLEKSGTTNGERLRGITLNHLANYLHHV